MSTPRAEEIRKRRFWSSLANGTLVDQYMGVLKNFTWGWLLSGLALCASCMFGLGAVESTNAPAAKPEGVFILGTHLAGSFDAPITIAGTDQGAGTIPGMVVQLYALAAGKLYPIGKPRTFLGTEGRKAMHIRAEEQGIPGTQAGNRVLLRLRAYNGKTFEASEYRGESEDFECTLAGGLALPSYPFKLKPFTVKKVQ